jgi:hypothetical protein
LSKRLFQQHYSSFLCHIRSLTVAMRGFCVFVCACGYVLGIFGSINLLLHWYAIAMIWMQWSAWSQQTVEHAAWVQRQLVQPLISSALGCDKEAAGDGAEVGIYAEIGSDEGESSALTSSAMYASSGDGTPKRTSIFGSMFGE